ncbi:MAG: tetratricopeptide repeat protein [Actinomycetota bacterium]|nr:tetratricopeptide repeat protein [Actinomycetota bacterium]
MIRKTVTISLATAAAAALALGGVGAIRNDDQPAAPRAAATTKAAEVASVDQVAFWQGRVDANADDFVSRTQLASSLLTRARTTHNTADAVTADGEIDQVLAVVPDDTSALLVKANARSFVHDFPTGLRYAQRVLDRDPTHKVAIAMVGDGHFELGDLDQAALFYTQLAERVGASPEVSARRARLAHARGDVRAALVLAEQAIVEAEAFGLAPADSTYYTFLLAEFQRLDGDYDASAESFEQILAVNDEDGAAIEGLAKAHAALGDLDEAERWWQKSGDLIGAPDFHVLAALGDIEFARGDEARARELWDEALDAVAALADEQQVGFLRDVSRFRSTRGLDIGEALALAERDFEIRQDAHAYDTLAWAQLANGDDDEALESIEDALATGIADAGVWYHAAEIYAANNDDTAALDLVRKALDLSPEFDLYEAEQARTLLADLS